jgi:hypothetical protein
VEELRTKGIASCRDPSHGWLLTPAAVPHSKFTVDFPGRRAGACIHPRPCVDDLQR